MLFVHRVLYNLFDNVTKKCGPFDATLGKYYTCVDNTHVLTFIDVRHSKIYAKKNPFTLLFLILKSIDQLIVQFKSKNII